LHISEVEILEEEEDAAIHWNINIAKKRVLYLSIQKVDLVHESLSSHKVWKVQGQQQTRLHNLALQRKKNRWVHFKVYFEISYVLLRARQHHLLSLLLLPIASGNATETQDADFCRMLCPDFVQICYILIYTICWKLMKPSVVSHLWQLIMAIPNEEGDKPDTLWATLVKVMSATQAHVVEVCLSLILWILCGYSNCKRQNDEGSKCVTRSQMDYIGKWLQVLFLKN
jgi:hypothetical protein